MASAAAVDIGKLIVWTPGVVGGSPRIAGSRIAVRHIADWYNLGMPVDEMLRRLPTIDRTGIYAAITYYLANRVAVDEDLADEERALQEASREPGSRVHRIHLDE
jgi:uncharacterized protein (DUF433 family)